MFGESVSVIGAGSIGLLIIVAAKIADAKETFSLDLIESRLEKA